MTSLADAFAIAESKPRKFGVEAEPMEVTDHQLRYAMTVSNKYAGYYRTDAISYDDLAQTGIEAILTTLRDKPHLAKYNAWMGKVAKWSMVDAIRTEYGRRGVTRQGKDRMVRNYEELQEWHASEQEDHDLRLTVEGMRDELTKAHADTITLLDLGYTKSEIAGILGVTPACVTLRVQAIRRLWHEALAG